MRVRCSSPSEIVNSLNKSEVVNAVSLEAGGRVVQGGLMIKKLLFLSLVGAVSALGTPGLATAQNTTAPLVSLDSTATMGFESPILWTVQAEKAAAASAAATAT